MDPKLIQLTEAGNFREKVEAILGHLGAKGLSPKIYEAKRTVEQQREKVRLGYSKTMRSNHLPGRDGLSRAADVADLNLAWNASKRFWMMLGAAALAHDVGWGGLFGLGRTQKANVVKCINRARAEGWPIKSEAYQCQLGWDVAHLEMGSNWP